MRSQGKLLTLALVCIAGLVTAAVALGAVVGERGTAIISPPGGLPTAAGPSDVTKYNGDGSRSARATPTTDPVVGTPRPADNLEFSQDNRDVRYAAFDSAATNLIAGKTGDGQSHVYLFTRKGGGSTTPELLDGKLTQVDAKGPSTKPSLDGQTKTGN